MRKIISLNITICFCLVNLSIPGVASINTNVPKLSLIEKAPRNLSVSSRFQPPVFVEWDEKEENYRLYDQTEKFKKEFKYKSQIAYVTALFGQFLKEQKKLQSKELNMSEDGLRKRFELFRELVIEKKNNDPTVFPDLNYYDENEINSLRLENNGTIWVSCDGPRKDSLYFYCFYLRKSKETEPYVLSLPVSDKERVICRRLGPFDASPIDSGLTGIGTKPLKLFELFRWSIFEYGSEARLEWNKEVNSRCVMDFFRYLQSNTEGFPEKVKRSYFRIMLTNILISTSKITSSDVRGPLADFLLLDNKEAKKESLLEFHASRRRGLMEKHLPEKEEEDRGAIEKMINILKKIKMDFREEGLSYVWLSEFQEDVKIILAPEDFKQETPDKEADIAGTDQEEMKGVLKRSKNAAEKLAEKMRSLIESLDKVDSRDLEVLRQMEDKITELIVVLLEGGQAETANQIVDKSFKELWTPERRKKVQYLLPTVEMLEISAMTKFETNRFSEIPFIMELLFESMKKLLDKVAQIDGEAISDLYRIEGSIDRIVTLLLKSNDLEDADLIANQYLYKLWTHKLRRRTGFLLPGHTMARLLAAVKFARNEYEESCSILEDALMHFEENRRHFRRGSTDEFEVNALLQMGEGYFRTGQLDRSEEVFNRLKEKLKPIIEDKTKIRKRKYIYVFMRLLCNLRDICYIKNDFVEAVKICKEMDLIIAEGNISLSSADTFKIVDECIARIDLSLRLWGLSDDQEKLVETFDDYRDKILNIHPGTDQLKLYDAWRAFKEERMDVLGEKLGSFSGKEAFNGKEYVCVLQLFKVAANYYKDIGDQDRANRLVDIGLDLMAEPVNENAFDRTIRNSLLAVKEGYEQVHNKILDDLVAKKYKVDDVLGITSLIFLRIPEYKKIGEVPAVFTETGEVNDIYELVEKLFDGNYKAIAYEYNWQIPSHRELFKKLLINMISSGSEILSPVKKLNILFFLGYTRKNNTQDRWLVDRLYELKEIVPTTNYVKGVDYLIEQIKTDFTAQDRLDEAKRFLSEGNFSEARADAEIGLERVTVEGQENEDLEIALEIAKDISDRITEAEDYYSAQRFIDAKDEYERAQEDLETLGIELPHKFKTAQGKMGIMAEAEERYLLSKDKKAIKISSRVKDSVSNDFRKKLKRVKGVVLGEAKHKKIIEDLRSKFPHDRRIKYVYKEFMRIQKKNKEMRVKQKQLLKNAKAILVNANGNGVDELCEAVAEVIDLVGFTKDIRNFVAHAADQYGSGSNNIEALKLLEKTKEMLEGKKEKFGDKLESMKSKYEDAVKKETINKKKQFSNKVFAKAGEWMTKRTDTKKLKNILDDIILVYNSNVFRARASKEYIRMLEIAYIAGFYNEVIVYAKDGRKCFGAEDDREFEKLIWKARAKKLIAKLEKHFNILDCEVKGEALSVKKRRYTKLYDSNDLQYNFDKAEYKNGKITISELFYYQDDKDKKMPDRIARILDCIMPNESYMMFTENEKGEKREIFLDVHRRDKDYVEFVIPHDEERNRLQPGETLKPGRLVRVSDPSLLRRRNKLGEYISVMENCINMGKMPSTGHKLYDIALQVSQEKVQKPEKKGVHFKDLKLANDKTQKTTVEACMNPELPFHLIQGPPGTGKTRVTVELIRQFYDQRKRVLVVSQSNPGIDNLGKKLLELQDKGEDVTFARVGNEELAVDEALRDNWNNRRDILNNMYADKKKGSVVLGTTNGFPAVVSNLTDKRMREYYSHFDVVIVEEAGRATLAETIYPISWVSDEGKVLLVGDHDQLPAYGIDRRKQNEIERELVADGYDRDLIKQYFSYQNVNMYKTSLFQDLWEADKYFRLNINKHFLTINRRSHWAIVRLVSELFYDSKIKPDPEKIDEELEEDTVRVIDYDRNMEPETNEKKTPGSSVVNLKEAYIVVDEVDRLLSLEKEGSFRYSAKDITVITPYDLQTRKVSQLLEIKAIINDLKTEVIFKDQEQEIRRKLEILETFLYDDPNGYDQKVINAIGKLKRDKKKRTEDINTVVFSDSFQKFGNKYSQRSFTYEEFNTLKVENVDSIQGSENKAVVLSLVRSNTRREIGFLGTKDGQQRLNVAFSRAQEKFTVIGDFDNTLCQADPRINGRYSKNIEKAVDVFNKTIDIYGDLYNNHHKNKDMGGIDADNREVITPIIENALQNKKALKLSFGLVPRFYRPRFIKDYLKWDDDVAEEVAPFLTDTETKRLEGYLKGALKDIAPIDGTIKLKDITIGVIKDEAYINPSSDSSFSLVHTGTRTATVWFGELFLKELLKKENDADMADLIKHELRHIVDLFGAEFQHKETFFEDLRYRLDARSENVRGRKETRDMLDRLSERSEKIKEDKKLIIGLDMSWVPDDQGLNILIPQIARLTGKDNIIIKIGEGQELASEIGSEVKDNDFSNVIILGSGETINNKAFSPMKNVSFENRAFFAQINPRELKKELEPGAYNYIRIIEMLNISLALAFKDSTALLEIRQQYPGIIIKETLDPKVFLFIPKAKPVQLKELNDLYKAQAKVLFSA